MAADEHKIKKGVIARLTPNSINAKIGGLDVRIAGNKDENVQLNMVMISMARALITKSIEKWTDLDETPSPKELNDLVASMSKLVDTSNVVYASEPIAPSSERPAEVTTDEADIDFTGLSSKPPEDKPETKDERASTD